MEADEDEVELEFERDFFKDELWALSLLCESCVSLFDLVVSMALSSSGLLSSGSFELFKRSVEKLEGGKWSREFELSMKLSDDEDAFDSWSLL